MRRLNSRGYKESVVGRSSSFNNQRQSKSSSASSALQELPYEIIVARPQDTLDLMEPNNETSIVSNRNLSLHPVLFPQSIPTSWNAEIGSSRMTRSISLETISDCEDNSIGTIDMLPSSYPSWELNGNFDDDMSF